jgi:hypothetical protein
LLLEGLLVLFVQARRAWKVWIVHAIVKGNHLVRPVEGAIWLLREGSILLCKGLFVDFVH